MDFSDLTIETAKHHVGAVFELDLGESTLELVLAEAVELPTGPAESAITSFSIRFEGPSTPILDQGSYMLSHGGSEAQPVFVVPVANDAGETVYEAIFTRL